MKFFDTSAYITLQSIISRPIKLIEFPYPERQRREKLFDWVQAVESPWQMKTSRVVGDYSLVKLKESVARESH